VVLYNGETIECDCLRDEEHDKDGTAFWWAVPRRPVRAEEAVGLKIEELPGRTSLAIQVEMLGLEAE